MKKKIIALLAIGIFCCGTLTACGGSKATKDLTGTWVSDTDGFVQEATITKDYIEINWTSDGTTSLYWAGTYTAPEEEVTEYSWVSENDTEKTSSSMLASSDETKEFTYKDGVINYKASAAGTTTTVKLKRK